MGTDSTEKKKSGAKKKTPGGFNQNEYSLAYQNERNAEARDISIRKCESVSRRADLIADPVAFIKHYFAERFWRPMSRSQIETIYSIVETARMGSDEIFCAPRGDWKTETAKAMIVYLIASELIRFPVIIGSTADDAWMKFSDIKSQFEKNEIFAADYPEICDPIRAMDGSPMKARKQTIDGVKTDFYWQAKFVTFPKVLVVPSTGKPSPFSKCALTYRGLDAAIRGINVYGRRPDLAFCDDLETRESADSDHQIEIRERLLDNDVAGLAGGGESLPRIVLGTIQNSKCLTNKKLHEWGGRQYKAVDNWPSPRGMELADEYIETRRDEKTKGTKTYEHSRKFYRDNREEIECEVVVGNDHCFSAKTDRDGVPMEVSTFQRVLNNASDNGWNYVWCELQNEPPEEKKVETIGLTAAKVISRISGLNQKESDNLTEFNTAAIDLGKYSCHWSITDWSEGLSGRITNYGVAEVHSEGVGDDKTQTAMALRSALMNWRAELLGGELSDRKPDIVLVDSSNFTDTAYSFVKEISSESSHFYAIKGLAPYRSYQPIDGKRIVGNHWHANLQGTAGVWLYLLDTDALKAMVHQMFATPTFDEVQQLNPLSLSLYSSFSVDGKANPRRHNAFAKHQTAEEYREEFKAGKGMVRGWHQTNPNNHWFDCSYMNLVAAFMLGMKPPFEPELTPAKVKNKRPEEKKKPRKQFNRNDRSFVSKRN